jgi:hypothetical protein
MTAPAKKQRGRPALPPSERRDHTVKARVTAAEAQKFDQLGGAEWLRRALKRAKAPTPTPNAAT